MDSQELKIPEPHYTLPADILTSDDYTYLGSRLDLALNLTGATHAGSFDIYAPEPAARLAGELQDLGLKTRIEPQAIAPGENVWMVVYSQDEADAAALASLFGKDDMDHAAYGRLCGIPETAIAAYPDRSLPETETPEAIRTHPYFAFRTFDLSRDHYEAEWAQYVERVRHILDVPQVASRLKLEPFIRSGIPSPTLPGNPP